MRDLKYDNFLYRRLRFASSTVNKILSLRDLTKPNFNLIFAEIAYMHSEISFFGQRYKIIPNQNFIFCTSFLEYHGVFFPQH